MQRHGPDPRQQGWERLNPARTPPPLHHDGHPLAPFLSHDARRLHHGDRLPPSLSHLTAPPSCSAPPRLLLGRLGGMSSSSLSSFRSMVRKEPSLTLSPSQILATAKAMARFGGWEPGSESREARSNSGASPPTLPSRRSSGAGRPARRAARRGLLPDGGGTQGRQI